MNFQEIKDELKKQVRGEVKYHFVLMHSNAALISGSC